MMPSELWDDYGYGNYGLGGGTHGLFATCPNCGTQGCLVCGAIGGGSGWDAADQGYDQPGSGSSYTSYDDGSFASS